MKTFFTLAITILLLAANPITSNAQCTPGDETTCPDPENNGEVCPAVLPNGIIGKEYSQEFTIIVPPEYEYLGNPVTLDHIKIKDVGNLPPNINWETNAADSTFIPGTYYCVLLSGDCNEIGTFPLKIIVDAYVDIPLIGIIKIPDITDSTSISLKVTWDPNGIETYTDQSMAINLWPNPFKKDIYFELPENGGEQLIVELYSTLGNLVLRSTFKSKIKNEKYHLEASSLPKGTYLLKVKSGNKQASRLIQKVL